MSWLSLLIWGGVAAVVLFVLWVLAVCREIMRVEPERTLRSLLAEFVRDFPAIVADEFKYGMNEREQDRQEERAKREAAKVAKREEQAKKPRKIGFFRSFVFLRALRFWPIVRHTGRGRWTMIAVHKAPLRTQNRGGLKAPVVTEIAIGIIALNWLDRNGWHDTGWPAAFFGVVGGLASLPFWFLFSKTWLRIRFRDGAMVWKGPEKQWRKRWHRVAADQPRSLQVLVPHRWAAEEFRKHADYARRHPRELAKKPLFQSASELIMHSGPGGSQWHTVAEFCNDGSGEKAHRLQQAIELVSAAAAEELEERALAVIVEGPL